MKLILNHVSAGYGSGKEALVLKDLSFSIEEGRSVSIVGPNGSGKTTLLKVLAGILPYQGSILVENNGRQQELSRLPRKVLSRELALMPQFSEVYFSYTVEETVLLGRYVHSSSRLGVPTARDLEIVRQSLMRIGLDRMEKKPVNELSGGQQQRVFLARTFAQETPFILLDEPTNHLDLAYQKELMTYLGEWQKGQTDGVRNTLVGVFHDLTLALSDAQDLIFLKNGEVAAAGAAQQVLTASLLEDIYGMDVVAEMKRRYRLWDGIQ